MSVNWRVGQKICLLNDLSVKRRDGHLTRRLNELSVN